MKNRYFNDLYESYDFLNRCELINYPNSDIKRLDLALAIDVIKKETETKIHLSMGALKEIDNIVVAEYDNDLEVHDNTYEKAIIKLAQKVYDKFYLTGIYDIKEDKDEEENEESKYNACEECTLYFEDMDCLTCHHNYDDAGDYREAIELYGDTFDD